MLSEWVEGEAHEGMRTLIHKPTGLKFICQDHRIAFDEALARRIDAALLDVVGANSDVHQT